MSTLIMRNMIDINRDISWTDLPIVEISIMSSDILNLPMIAREYESEHPFRPNKGSYEIQNVNV